MNNQEIKDVITALLEIPVASKFTIGIVDFLRSKLKPESEVPNEAPAESV